MPAKKPVDPEMSAAAKKRVAGYQRGAGGRFAPKATPITIDTLTAHSQAAADLGNQLGHSPALRHALEQVADANRQIEQLKGRITGLQEALGEAKAEARAHKSQAEDTINALDHRTAILERIQSVVGGHLIWAQLPGAVEHLRGRAGRALELEEKAREINSIAWDKEAVIATLRERLCAEESGAGALREELSHAELRINNLREDLNALGNECARLQAARDIFANELAATKTELEALQKRGFWARILNLGVAK